MERHSKLKTFLRIYKTPDCYIFAVTIFCRIHSDFPAVEKRRKIPGVVIAGQVRDLRWNTDESAGGFLCHSKPLFRDIVVQALPEDCLNKVLR